MAELAVGLYDVEIGALLGERDEFIFVASPEAIERFGIGSTQLSIAVPLFEHSSRKNDLQERNFFEELLSEGAVRAQLASNARLDSTNTMALLARYGRDVAGALQIWDPTDPAEPRTPEARPVTDTAIVAMFDDVGTNPLGNKGRRRLSSLAGVQDKVLLAYVDGVWAEPLDGYPSTHILKPQSGRFRSLIFDEEYGSRFTRGLRLADFDTRIQTFDGRSALVIERYDREDGGRIHQEDFNQVLGYRGDAKYEQRPGDGRLRAIAATLREHATVSEVRTLVRMLTMSTALGNLDMHSKNISLLHAPGGEIRLAPQYDVVPQLHMDLDDDVALLVNGKSGYFDIDGEDLLAEVGSWGLRNARTLIADALEETHAIAEAEQPLPGADPSLVGMITRQTQRLLDTLPMTTARQRARQTPQRPDRVFPQRNAPGGWGGPVG
ncbi:HipA domain-containing protein [Microbacterium sp. Mu-80]|uniref:HipA domain-containing protein n=1 Tax=Microbacterium bandirmense TaxID=3122050 RepID=A0ABU8LD19_9MICO